MGHRGLLQVCAGILVASSVTMGGADVLNDSNNTQYTYGWGLSKVGGGGGGGGGQTPPCPPMSPPLRSEGGHAHWLYICSTRMSAHIISTIIIFLNNGPGVYSLPAPGVKLWQTFI